LRSGCRCRRRRHVEQLHGSRFTSGALRLLDATSASVVRLDRELLQAAALAMPDREALVAVHDMLRRPTGRGTAARRAIATHGVVAIPTSCGES
jgi:hypothetical protein